MKPYPDKLFQSKLEKYSKPAPSAAWSKIEAGLDKKSNTFLWLKIAASLLVLSVAVYLLWPKPKMSTVAPIASKKEMVPPVKETVMNQKIIAQPQIPRADNGIPKDRNNSKAEIKKSDILPAITKQEKQQAVAQYNDAAIDQLNEIVIKESISEENITVSIPAETVTAEHTLNENVTLVISIEQTDEYLDKKTLAEATSDNKNTSTFKKLLRKAADLKNDQDPMGELRQMKDEILALNFKKKNNVDKTSN